MNDRPLRRITPPSSRRVAFWKRGELDRCEKLVPEQLVFFTRGFVKNAEYRRVFDPAAEKIGVPGLVPHELRHTCASLAIASGANILAVHRLLGHETASMTLDLYGHLFSDDLTNVAKSLDKAAKAALRG